MQPEITIMGFMVGILVGLTGVGGAALLTPILLLLGVNPSVAVGTDLMYNSITKFFGTIQHWRQKTIDKTIVRYLAYGSVPGAIVSVGMLHMFDFFYNNQETIIKHALGIILIIVSILILVKVLFDVHFKSNPWQLKKTEEKKTLTILIGLILGFIVGLTSIGSGSLFAVAILYFYRVKASQLVGTDVAHAFLLVTAAGLMHASFQNVDYMLVLNLIVGSVPGVLLGSRASTKVPGKPLRAAIAILILISGIKLL
ncbi:sulfite exporter TauE/SafE family protein [Pseudalkalibacillus caeni]|uniref:Probable membrane transporter protein n=1 Tax=Exobacillus caeni TaxID=2574798 RepID=A0A5R9EY88_9BACL|nr:sulfite exporter TauE/SafE family protein [Pseudalkalibacillus caeni]TLS35811.1 sulfite exporter TauE/SafE family protein [Pseudalkalibacillus caeni]